MNVNTKRPHLINQLSKVKEKTLLLLLLFSLTSKYFNIKPVWFFIIIITKQQSVQKIILSIKPLFLFVVLVIFWKIVNLSQKWYFWVRHLMSTKFYSSKSSFFAMTWISLWGYKYYMHIVLCFTRCSMKW